MFRICFFIAFVLMLPSGVAAQVGATPVTAAQLLGNPDYAAISFGGFRHVSQEKVPTVNELKEDLRILSALGIKVLRTYKTQKNAHAENLLKAINQLRAEDPKFEMYVMLGVWIDCEGAWTDAPNHEVEDEIENTAEIETAVRLAKQYPESVKVIAVGNEAMVNWAASYFVRPAVILKWVQYLQKLKKQGDLPSDLWITSSDNFASWGGGDIGYQTEELKQLIRAVDYVSLHTYPFHDSHYNAEYWQSPDTGKDASRQAKADRAMDRAIAYAIEQYEKTKAFVHDVDPQKPVHIGETGWSTNDNGLYGEKGSGAADEYKQKRYYDGMRQWSDKAGVSCFFFEAFDEPWKDAGNQAGSENHFGIFTVDGKAKFAIWDQVDRAGLSALKRGAAPVKKTHDGDINVVMKKILDISSQPLNQFIETVNPDHVAGQPIQEDHYRVLCNDSLPPQTASATFPSERLKANIWEGTCQCSLTEDGHWNVVMGDNENKWWGCALEIQADGKGENLSEFSQGQLHFDIKGTPDAEFQIGFQTGLYTAGNQTNNGVTFQPGGKYQLSETWKSYVVPLADMDQSANLTDVTSLLFVRGSNGMSDAKIEIRNVYYAQ
ncbi:MAG: glycosyl hydrolase family 17 protein [Pirellulaceae bacterium]|nr:glycosyl hydrolase family 17 protein [Pirellulaceae bacterium]